MKYFQFTFLAILFTTVLTAIVNQSLRSKEISSIYTKESGYYFDKTIYESNNRDMKENKQNQEC
jgi:hypothetical protein